MHFYYSKLYVKFYFQGTAVVVLALVCSAFVKTPEAAPTPTRDSNTPGVLPLLKMENALHQTSAAQQEPLRRSKREIIFRPLFVYRQQQIKHNQVHAKYQMHPDKIDYNYYAGQFL
uniref:Uncharacterized protein n=1 Tax=Anopheles albimanus TaxID=7167 RepID=A0A182FY36_ANOAL